MINVDLWGQMGELAVLGIIVFGTFGIGYVTFSYWKDYFKERFAEVNNGEGGKK